ncbi:hypothetical protein L3N51_01316 [Metallosphaera sp. J1]|uniref:hypothetical protein n=1 Tax=Metallosphaera TaxID=41980 RepID=UPI001EDF0D3B|nr:hypothetical protein [Metallosphaera javensis (ex Hofmann et al. 2022)]MCG3109026.1 hypothetical protein [Metallosphaera javensis (ex Hofmann et al. 2022)]BCS92549.1 MAG: hypothetical protein MjAS7_1157 [Metallosphaera javensis (ex Sakai et al. 2022)]
MKRESRKKDKKRPTNVVLVVMAILIIAVGITLLELRTSSYSTVIIGGVSEINQMIEVSPSVVAFVGSSAIGNHSQGVAGLFYVQNHTYEFLNVSQYFANGSIYSISYNGSAFLLGGARYVPQGNTSVLEPTLILMSEGKVYNLSGEIPSFYTPGQIFSVTWQKNFWLIGGSSLVIEGSSTFQVPFLLKLSNNLTDLTGDYPSILYKPLSVGSGIFTLSSNESLSFIGGSHLFNYTITIFNGTNFTDNFQGLGAVITSAPTPAGWLFGGFNYSLNNTHITLTMLGILNQTGIHFILLKYQVGLVNSVGYGDGKYIVSLRIPVVNNFSGIASEEGVILWGSSLHMLSPVFSKLNTSVNSVLGVPGYLLGGGYISSSQGREGVIIIIKT